MPSRAKDRSSRRIAFLIKQACNLFSKLSLKKCWSGNFAGLISKYVLDWYWESRVRCPTDYNSVITQATIKATEAKELHTTGFEPARTSVQWILSPTP